MSSAGFKEHKHVAPSLRQLLVLGEKQDLAAIISSKNEEKMSKNYTYCLKLLEKILFYYFFFPRRQLKFVLT